MPRFYRLKPVAGFDFIFENPGKTNNRKLLLRFMLTIFAFVFPIYKIDKEISMVMFQRQQIEFCLCLFTPSVTVHTTINAGVDA